MKKFPQVVLFAFIFFLFGVQTAWGHAYVVEQSPMPNSQYDISPTEVKIKFNSEVESNFAIKVFDEQKIEVKSYSPTISDDQKEISIQLPTLSDGLFKIEYYIISSNDGHVIQGDYFILVGENTNSLINQENGNPNSLNNWNDINFMEIIIYVLKSLYYFGLVLLIGWLIWWQTVKHYSNEITRKYILWGIVFQMIHLLGLISVILIQVDIFTSKGLFFTPNFPFDTSFGSFWLMSLVLALIGFLCLFKNRWIDITWITILVFCKSLNGHAGAFDFTFLTVPLNSIHLIAAGIWAAGLTFMVLFWRKQKLYVTSFLPTFSKYALISFILMALSGSIISFIYSPSFLLLSTDWSFFLFIKILVVVIVIIIASIIRSKINESHSVTGKWIHLDFFLMILIIFIVSILTFFSPTP